MRLAARAAGRSDVGLHRQTNEDSWVVRPFLFAVADGMGGAKAGEVASRVAIQTLVEHLPRLAEADEEAAGAELAAAAEDANARVYALSVEHRSQAGMGTTLTVLLLTEQGARVAHIGDSRAYVLRDGILEQVTDDHSLVGEMVRNGEISLEEAAGHPLRSVLSRALGTEPEVEIDLLEVDVRAGDTLLLCSDGLSGVVPHDKLAELAGEDSPGGAAERLVKAALALGGPDNITALVIRLEEATDASSAQAAAESAAAVAQSEDVDAAGEAPDEAPSRPPAPAGVSGPKSGETAGPGAAEEGAGTGSRSDDGDEAGEPALLAEAASAALEPAADSGEAAGRRRGWWRLRRRDRGR